MKGYKRYDKNFICLPRQDRKNRGRRLKNRGFEGMREIFHLETTFFGFGGGKSGLISAKSGEGSQSSLNSGFKGGGLWKV